MNGAVATFLRVWGRHMRMRMPPRISSHCFNPSAQRNNVGAYLSHVNVFFQGPGRQQTPDGARLLLAIAPNPPLSLQVSCKDMPSRGRVAGFSPVLLGKQGSDTLDAPSEPLPNTDVACVLAEVTLQSAREKKVKAYASPKTACRIECSKQAY
eukprot:1148648-Pelagomonas_calceolata.AAC.10